MGTFQSGIEGVVIVEGGVGQKFKKLNSWGIAINGGLVIRPSNAYVIIPPPNVIIGTIFSYVFRASEGNFYPLSTHMAMQTLNFGQTMPYWLKIKKRWEVSQ